MRLFTWWAVGIIRGYKQKTDTIAVLQTTSCKQYNGKIAMGFHQMGKKPLSNNQVNINSSNQVSKPSVPLFYRL